MVVNNADSRFESLIYFVLELLSGERGHACGVTGRQFLHTSVYAPPSSEAVNRELDYYARPILSARFKVLSIHLASVNISVTERNATDLASGGEFI